MIGPEQDAAGPSRPVQDSEGGSLDIKDPFRKAMPVMDAEEDVCCICLDEFTTDDPGVFTICEHGYHLQCIMQWAQRSRECPLCYRDLRLKDPGLHEMLPFGEYVPPEHATTSFADVMGMEAWEIDRLIQRLALQKQPGHRRTRNRHSRHADAASSNAVPLGSVPAASASIAVPQTTRVQSGGAEFSGNYPGSWPPRAHASNNKEDEQHSSRPLRNNVSAEVKPAAETFKSRWSSFQAKCRESFGGRSSGVSNH